MLHSGLSVPRSSLANILSHFQVSVPQSGRFPHLAFTGIPHLSKGIIKSPSLPQTRVITTTTMSSKPIPGHGTAKSAAQPPEPRPSASVIILSPRNEVLLLHRVQTSTSFASAHVFPGGNLDSFHDGVIPPPDHPSRHKDGPAYRMAAIRECFEECGILLAKKPTTSSTTTGTTISEPPLITIPPTLRDQKRKQVHAGQTSFPAFLAEIGAEPDIEGLIPFTRWITPIGVARRFTTQMYLYFLPLAKSNLTDGSQADGTFEEEATLPTPDGDGGVEHSAATFAPPKMWLDKTLSGDIFLMPPQAYLLHLIQEVTRGPSAPSIVAEQRKALVDWLRKTPTAERSSGKEGFMVPWAEKVMSPIMLGKVKDGRVALSLDAPPRELGRGGGKLGDPDRVVLVKFAGGKAREVEVRRRDEVVKAMGGGGEGKGGGKSKM